MNLKSKIRENKFLITSEIGPPKGIETGRVLDEARLLGSRVDAVNVTDLQSSVLKLGSLAVCSILKQQGIEPVFQVTCRDRNRLALQSDILSAAALGIENILVLTGDHPLLGDHPDAKPVFDLDSVQLLQVVKKLQEGFDMKGNKLEGAAPQFCVGAVVNPGADPLEPQLIKMEKKLEAGVDFFQTQAVYDVRSFEKFLSKVKHLKTTILAGIVLLKSANMARFMNKNVAGVVVPDEFIKEMEEATDKQQKSIEIAARLIKELRPFCQGVHIMPIGWTKVVPSILDQAGL